MTTADAGRVLEPLDTTGTGGCGGCGCGNSTDPISSPGPRAESTIEPTEFKETSMPNQTYAVTGMTCGHCVSAVTSELTALGGVIDVQVGLVAGGTSTVKVTSTRQLDDAQVAAALEEAGDYHLADPNAPARPSPDN